MPQRAASSTAASLRASASSFRPISRANSPGCGVRIRGPPGWPSTSGFGGQGIQGVGVKNHRLGDLLIEPHDELIQLEGAAQAGAAGDDRGRLEPA